MMRIRSGDTLFPSSAAGVAAMAVWQYCITDVIGGDNIQHGSLFGPTAAAIIPSAEYPACAVSSSAWVSIDVTKPISAWTTLRSDYYDGLARSAELFAVPITADGKPVSGDDIQRVREVVFEELRYQAELPEAVNADSSACSRINYADVSHDPVSTNGALVTQEYPALAGLTPEEQLWVQTHELGHAIDAVVHAVPKFNKLPLAERMEILTELQTLRDALAAKGHTVSYSNGTELLANLYAALLLEPNLAETHAHKASQFFGGLVNDHPELGKILHFK